MAQDAGVNFSDVFSTEAAKSLNILCKPPCLLLYQSMKYLHVAAFSMFVSKNKTGTPKVIKPVSRPACRASLLLQSPA